MSERFEAGGLGADSLFARFHFTRDALLAATERARAASRSSPPGEMPPEFRIYVHELTHYLQYATTPYGLFLHYCRVLQNRATIEIVQAILAAQGDFRMPVLRNIPQLTGEAELLVRSRVALWLNVENVVASLSGDQERINELGQVSVANLNCVQAGLAPLLPPLLDFREAFARVQKSIADLMVFENLAAEQMGNSIPVARGVSDADLAAIDAELEEATGRLSDRDYAQLRVHDLLDVLGNPLGIESIIESAAAAAEVWGSAMSYDDFVAWVEAPVAPRLRVYRNCIAQALPSIRSRDLWIVIPTYIAVCELALSAPLLPEHAALRRRHSDFNQILPAQRWAGLLRVLGGVRPMNGRGDHGRFMMDICRALDWVHPLQIVKVAVNGPPHLSDPRAQIYNWAQRIRAQSSGDFIGFHRYLLEDSAQAAQWRAWFDFVIVDYADRTVYHRDKDFLEAMTTRHLQMLGLRLLMVGKRLVLRAPYRGDENELRFMTEFLQELFRSLFGSDFPALRFVPAE